jgi:hypothetical protein
MPKITESASPLTYHQFLKSLEGLRNKQLQSCQQPFFWGFCVVREKASLAVEIVCELTYVEMDRAEQNCLRD